MTPDKCPRCGSDRLPLSRAGEIDQCRRKPGLPDAPDHCPAVIDGEVCGAPVRARGVDAFGCPWTDWTCGNGDSWGSHNSNCLTFIWERRREAYAAWLKAVNILQTAADIEKAPVALDQANALPDDQEREAE